MQEINRGCRGEQSKWRDEKPGGRDGDELTAWGRPETGSERQSSKQAQGERLGPEPQPWGFSCMSGSVSPFGFLPLSLHVLLFILSTFLFLMEEMGSLPLISLPPPRTDS